MVKNIDNKYYVRNILVVRNTVLALIKQFIVYEPQHKIIPFSPLSAAAGIPLKT
jgi:hypothetical protein